MKKIKARKMRDLMFTEGWAVYEEFIKEFVFEHLASNYSKDVLAGLKLAVDEAKKFVEKYTQ